MNKFSLYFVALFLMTSVIASADDVRTYKIYGIGYSVYDTALLSISQNQGQITGTVKPLIGDSTPPIEVTGDNSSGGVMHLKFLKNAAAKFNGAAVTLTKSIQHRNIEWSDRDGAVNMWRPLKGEFSEAGKTLTYQPCGGDYGGLMVARKAGVSIGQVRSALSADTILANSIVQAQDDDSREQLGDGETGLLAKAHPKSFPSYKLVDFLTSQKNFRFDSGEQRNAAYIIIPTGTEVWYARRLRETKIFNADLDVGACGGGDRSYFTTNKSDMFNGDVFSDKKFISFIEERLSGIISDGGKYKFFLSKPDITKVKVPPFPSDLRFQVRMASEGSRGDEGFWDQFTIYFEPFDNVSEAADKYSVVTWVERMRTVKRSSGNDSPPDSSYFSKELDYYYEAIAATQFASKLSGGDCVFEEEGFPDSLDDPKLVKMVSSRLRCTDE